MRYEKTVQEHYKCDECNKTIIGSTWYRIFLNEKFDFCSYICAETFRNSFYRIISHEKYPRVLGNTD